jgi:phospholipid-binding lipoprotein MlaA
VSQLLRDQPGIRAALIAASVLSGGCASQSTSEREPNPDPFEPVNRVMYTLNDYGDRYIAEPVAKGYEKATPLAVRRGANNFFSNLRYPITIINDFLQGKAGQGGADLTRFLMNSTVGLLGVFDPATAAGFPEHDEDLGQTLAVWGVPPGPYFMVPVFGPYTLGHGLGALADTQVSVLTQYDDSSLTGKLGIGYLVHERYQLLDATDEVRAAFDPYVFVRDAYFQNRQYLIYDGNVPEEEMFPEDEFDEE